MKSRSSKLFKIQEVAKKTGLTERTLRFYESEGLLKIYHTPGGMRLYTPANLKQINEIKKLALKHKIAEVKKMVSALPTPKPVLFVDPTVSPDFQEFETDFVKVFKLEGNPINFEWVQKKCWQLIEAGHVQFYSLHTSAVLSKNFAEFSQWVKEARDFNFQIIDSAKMGLAFLPWLESLKTKQELNFETLKNYEEFFYIPALELSGAMGTSFHFSPLITFDQKMKVVERDLSPEGFQKWLQEAELAGKKTRTFSGESLSSIHSKHFGSQAIGIVQY